MDKKSISVRTVAAIGIGSALMFVLTYFVVLPSGVPNTMLSLAPAILTLFAAVFGPVAGMLIGLIGSVLVELTWANFWGGSWINHIYQGSTVLFWEKFVWSWIIANAAYGFFIGLFRKFYKIEEGDFKFRNALIFNIIQILSNIVAWVLIAPVLDILIYGEQANMAFINGLTAAGLNSEVVLVLGTILAFGYSKTRTKAGNLHADN